VTSRIVLLPWSSSQQNTPKIRSLSPRKERLALGPFLPPGALWTEQKSTRVGNPRPNEKVTLRIHTLRVAGKETDKNIRHGQTWGKYRQVGIPLCSMPTSNSSFLRNYKPRMTPLPFSEHARQHALAPAVPPPRPLSVEIDGPVLGQQVAERPQVERRVPRRGGARLLKHAR